METIAPKKKLPAIRSHASTPAIRPVGLLSQTHHTAVRNILRRPDQEKTPPEGIPSRTESVEERQRASIRSIIGTGHSLPPKLRDFFEPHLGQNLEAVRLHTSGGAAGTARKLNAKAFTLGRDIVFGEGWFQPDTRSGRKLLAHELVHVLQQHGTGERIMMSREDPNRYSTIHSHLFPPPSPTEATEATEEEAQERAAELEVEETREETREETTGAAFEARVESQFRERLAIEVPAGSRPATVLEADTIEQWAIDDADPRIRSRFPQISRPALSPDQIVPVDPSVGFPNEFVNTVIEIG